MNTDYRPDPLLSREENLNQTEFYPGGDGAASAAEDFGQEEVMGGLSGSIARTNNEEQCNDPGQIVEGHRNMHSNRAGENIVINADSLKKESILEDSRNAIQSLMGSITTPAPITNDEHEKNSNPKSINAEVKLAHDEYKRRFQGRPTNRESKMYTINPEPCTGKFIVTKVRSWRAGYARILSLHKTYFATLDPETHEITNLWYYSQVRHYMALVQEEDCMLIDVLENNQGSTKLKFKCAPKNRNEALTSFIQHIYRHESLISVVRIPGNRHPTFEQCQRLTRHKTRVNSSLLCAPHGLVELDPTTGSELRTYLYRHIRALSFLSDDINGVVFYINETNNSVKSVRCECKAWFVSSSRIGGSGRSELVTLLKNKFEVLVIPFIISESVTTRAVVEMKYGRALKSVIGERIGEFPVRKFSLRQKNRSQSNQSEGPGCRSLVLTVNGYILEYDKSGDAASCRPLNDMMNIVRNSQTSDQFTIEFTGGIQRKYSSDQRETVIVSILDATVYMCKNFDVTVTDVESIGYKMLSSIEENEMRDSTTSVAQNLFQMDPIESQCMNIVYEVCTVTSAYIQYLCFIKGSNLIPEHVTNECVGVTEVCREFNANVGIQSLCNLPNEKREIEGTIRALWGLCSTLLKYINGYSEQGSSASTCTDSIQNIYSVLVPMFQTLYRLMMTEIGYSLTAILKEMSGALNEIWMIQDSFGLYWALKCVSALLLPRPFTKERDNPAEFHNKGVLITSRTAISVNLVRCMVGKIENSEKYWNEHSQCYDLVSMVASNIIESILCSHHETTTPVQVASFIDELSKEYVGVMNLLRSSTSVLVENASLFVRIIETRSPKTADAIRESALTSGVLLNHFYESIFSSSEGQRFLSRYLCGFWMSGPCCAEKLLLKRMIPPGFFPYLSMPKLGKEEENQLDLLEQGELDTNENLGDSKPVSRCAGTNINRFRARVKIAESMPTKSKKSQADNFRIFFHVLGQDHSLPDLVWNKNTRMDMKDALEAELKSIDTEIKLKDGIQNIAWNHEQFSVKYPSLEKEVCVGSVYMRLWLQASDSFVKTWDDPVRLFELLFRRLLIDFGQNIMVTNMCIRCLERLYSAHAKKIGAFPDIAILLKYMRTTTNAETKYTLLSLIAVLLGVNDEKYGTVDIRENAEQLMNVECIDFFCILVSQCHFDANSFVSLPVSPNIQASDVDVSFLKEDLLDANIYAPTKVSTIALRCLERLVSVHKSTDSRGVPYFPIPIAKRLICESSASISLDEGTRSRALPIICQCILSKNIEVVTASSKLIRLLTNHNEKACSNLYLTGIFFFACANSSSSWQSLAGLLHDTHLRQAFLSSTDTISEKIDSPPEPRSILEDMIPEGLLKVLMNRGPQIFARVFVGKHDTPEVIWSPAMRHHLISMLLEHLRDFSEMLREENTSNYNFCPIPEIQYKRLDREIFCHNYYLNNLCDEDRFPNWTIHEPFSVFLSCIERWRKIMMHTHNEEVVTLKEAKALFKLKGDEDGIELRQAYRTVAKDNLKSADSCKMYLSIRAAYQTLLAAMQSPCDEALQEDEFSHTDTEGLNLAQSQMFPTFLLMKTQLLICKRYSDEIGKYKYPAYSILLSCLQLPLNKELHSTFRSLGRAKFVRVAIELLFYSCLVSPLNAEELVNECGLQVLANLLQSYVVFISSLGKEKLKESEEVVSLHMESLVYIVHTIAGVSYYEFGRSAIAEFPESFNFYKNWKHCIDLQFIGDPIHGCNLLKRFALEGLVSMTKNSQLQAGLAQTGLMWNLVHCCLDFDPSLELASLDTEDFEISISQQEINYYGGMAARALGMLCGIMIGDYASPSNESLFDAMKHVLTPPIARMLSSNDSAETLRTLNLNIETPMILWDAKMRCELMNFVAEMESKSLNDDISVHLKAAEEFEYSNLADEMNIGGVYVRLFNKLDVKDAVREIPNTHRFAHSLIRFIGRSLLNDKVVSEVIQRTHVESGVDDRNEVNINIDKESMWCPVTDDRFYECVNAVLRLSKIDGLIDDVMCAFDAPEILMSLVALQHNNQAFPIALEVLSQIGTKQAFTVAIVKRGVLPWYLSALMFQFEDHFNRSDSKQDPRWSILETLASSSPVALSLVESSGWFELLSIVSGCRQFSKMWAAREGAARIIVKLLHDPQVSTTTASLLQQFIPSTLVTLLKNNGAEALLLAFDNDSGTPELVWDASMRIELQQCISSFIEKLFDTHNERIIQSTSFALPTGFHFKYKKTMNEMCIGGVYVRLYLEDPSIPLHDYNGFLQALLVRWSEEMELSTEKHIITTTQSYSPDLLTGQKSIELVTNAVICICDLRPFLLERLSSWGYTKNVVNFILKAKSMNMIEMPLLSSFRLLGLLSSELLTVEDLITIVDTKGKCGVVDATMIAIDGNPLHPDSALMVEALKKVFYTALGDVDSCSMVSKADNPDIDTAFMAYAMAPSPAPGTESVKKIKQGSADHPLAMMFDDAAPSPPKSSRAVRPNNKQPIQRQKSSNISKQASDFANNRHLSFRADQVVHSNTQPIPRMSNRGFDIQHSVQNSSSQVPRVLSSSHPYQGVQASGKKQSSPPMGKRVSIQQQTNHQPRPMLRNSIPAQGGSFTISHNANASHALNHTQGMMNSTLSGQSNNLRTSMTHSSQGIRVYHGMQSPPVTNSSLSTSPNPNAGANGHYLQKRNTNLQESPLISTIQASPIMGVDNSSCPSLYPAAVQQLQNESLPSTNSLISVPSFPVDIQTASTFQSQQQYPPEFAITEVPIITHPPRTPAMIADERMQNTDGAPNSARGRKILLDSALACGLPAFCILSVLENPNLNSVKNATATKAHTLELLHLMLKDPGYGLQFELVLNAIPNGKKYKLNACE